MYKTARKEARLGTEEASFRLHISRKTLINYENGTSTIPPEVVRQMAIVYKKPELMSDHCSKNCAIGQIITQELRKLDIATSVLSFLKEFEDVHKLKHRLIEIVSDGKFEEVEMPDFKAFMKELRDLKRAICEIEQFSLKKLGLEITFEKEKPASKERVRANISYA